MTHGLMASQPVVHQRRIGRSNHGAVIQHGLDVIRPKDVNARDQVEISCGKSIRLILQTVFQNGRQRLVRKEQPRVREPIKAVCPARSLQRFVLLRFFSKALQFAYQVFPKLSPLVRFCVWAFELDLRHQITGNGQPR